MRGIFILAAAFLAASAAQASERCTALAQADFSAALGATVTMTGAEPIAADGALPSYCRVTAVIAPRIGVEIRLPLEGWQGRVLTAGCGGLCGEIQMTRTDDALIRGYAVAHTDMGHQDTSRAAQATIYGDPQTQEDFAHRATHLTTRLLKAAAARHYGEAHRASYFRGCSTGGRQALTAAVLHPEDYDGIIAIAPSMGAGAVPNIAWAVQKNTAADGTAILDEKALKQLHQAALAACDRDDGVNDGVIANPLACTFDPAALQCANPAAQDCLTREQVEAARAIYDGVRDIEGRAVTMGFAKGGELGWLRTLVAKDGKPAGGMQFAASYPRRLGPDAPSSLAALDFTRAPVALTALDAVPQPPGGGQARFAAHAARGGKLLMLHGWSDESLSPSTSLDPFLQEAAARGGIGSIAQSVRLFLAPGLQHCIGGPGPGAIDTLSAIEAWVERGQAPERLIAYREVTVRDFRTEPRFPLPAEAFTQTRPLFPYPDFAVYRGEGAVEDAANFTRSAGPQAIPPAR
jgi:feruloyl esterase